MRIGEVNELTVKRISDIAYVLDDEGEEIFLHKKEALEDLNVGDKVKVFLYIDSKRRVAASTATPLITTSKPAFLKVVSKNDEMGFFLDDGMPKDLLLSMRDFPYPIEYAPNVGDYLFVKLQVSNNSFRAKLLPKEAFLDYMHPSGILLINTWVKAYVVNITINGLIAYTLDGRELFVPKDLIRGRHRIGEELSLCVIKITDDRRYQATALKPKLEQLDEDAKRVLAYLKKNKRTNLTDKSDPMAIYQTFQLSKAAYKRALGKLYKEHVITLSDELVELKVE
ncbi:MAG: hypothetical protein K6G38_00655 [Gammaproteobacteria bacterium]|nr:hypothetical protein [Gammaproteobacteria bacterium]